jgi:hypothetical protein
MKLAKALQGSVEELLVGVDPDYDLLRDVASNDSVEQRASSSFPGGADDPASNRPFAEETVPLKTVIDRSQALFNIGQQIQEIAAALVGGQAPDLGVDSPAVPRIRRDGRRPDRRKRTRGRKRRA